MLIDSPLKPKSALIVELTALKRDRPVRIVLTPEDALSVNSRRSLSEFCETTYPPMTESEMPKSGDELAVRISPSGAVHVSHNNAGWIKRMNVNADFEYRVIFDMEHISVLTTIGIANGLPEVEENQAVDHSSSSRSARSDAMPLCVICSENVRDVIIKPCSHVALCETCARTLRRSRAPVCPICRKTITDVERVYLA